MCDLKVYIKKNDDKEELFLESVNHVQNDRGELIMRNLFGEEKRIRGQFRELSLAKNRLVVEQA